MCLYIDKTKHRRGIIKTYCKIAKEDICVYKLLRYVPFRGYYTPFRYKPVIFNENMCTLKADKFKGTTTLNEITHGVHAYLYCPNSDFYQDFNAIIPKGTKYYLGKNGDIVAEQMLIFRNSMIFYLYCNKFKVVRIY